MDQNNNRTWKSDFKVMGQDKNRNYQCGSFNIDKGPSHTSLAGVKEHQLSRRENNGKTPKFENDFLFVLDDKVEEKLQTTSANDFLGIKEGIVEKNDLEVCSERLNYLSSLDDKRSEFGLEFPKSGNHNVCENQIKEPIENKCSDRVVGKQVCRTQKLIKKQSVQGMISQSRNIKDNFLEHMVDLADQAERDSWINTAADDTDDMPSQYDTDESSNTGLYFEANGSAVECQLVDAENNIGKKTVEDDIVLRKRNYYREKSQSSNTLIAKPRDVTVPKVKMEKSAQIIDARPKSHHFLW